MEKGGREREKEGGERMICLLCNTDLSKHWKDIPVVIKGNTIGFRCPVCDGFTEIALHNGRLEQTMGNNAHLKDNPYLKE